MWRRGYRHILFLFNALLLAGCFTSTSWFPVASKLGAYGWSGDLIVHTVNSSVRNSRPYSFRPRVPLFTCVLLFA